MTQDTLLGKTLNELTDIVKLLGLPGFTSKQICDWLYQKRVTSIDEMTNLSLKARNQLKEKYIVGRSTPVSAQKSQDGTIKYLFGANENQFIESVYIPDKERATLCVSSQVGCKMNCLFCMTGKQGFSGNLTSGEIINQIESIPESESLTNLVFMGMGEPLDNTENVFKALEILTATWGFAWSPKRITVSSSGLKKGLLRFLEESQCHVAISLHSPFPDERLSIMPAEKAFPIKELVEMLRQYDFSKQRRLSFEYIMFKDFNDSPRHANALAQLLKGLDCRINLIRFHAIPGINLNSSDEKRMFEFRDFLTKSGLHTTIRASRGEDIFAACGMLSTEESKKKADE
ncbi:23S rRNA (adenine(2503)-C(2))-methyltransferase RlmN [Parabacteroides sp. FAFU027]|uniref:23S rRNA (adenine(2503)-C(2))-methyltransferase RlmN n=1 Tax=Parabacteroides sp. FAFU027 TaxID=2922715 RepID=UPI001FAE9605|nr:23S rRNA (adenine(2503)-C(2))-methyltransferase RlmN [Parabacteroides sp. FAFU027]